MKELIVAAFAALLFGIMLILAFEFHDYLNRDQIRGCEYNADFSSRIVREACAGPNYRAAK